MAGVFRMSTSAENLKIVTRRYKELTKEECPPISAFRAVPPITKLKYGTMYYHTIGGEAAWADQGLDVRTYKEHGGVFRAKSPVSHQVQGFIVAVTPYLPNKVQMHTSHVIAAVQYNDTLICFNAWGKGALPKDKNVWKFLAKQYKCKKTIVYRGPSLQSDDTYGLCVGYTSNFVLEMLLTARKGKMDEVIKTQSAFDTYINKVLRTRGVCFGGKCVLRPDFHKRMFGHLNRDHKNATPKSMKNMTECELKAYVARRFSLKSKARSKKTLLSQAAKALDNQMKSPGGIVAAPKPKPKAPPKPKTPPKPPSLSTFHKDLRAAVLARKTMKELKQLARNKGYAGFSKYATRVGVLRKFVGNKMFPSPSKAPTPVRKMSSIGSGLNTMKLANMRVYAKAKGIKGYSKYTKMANLRGFIRTKL